MGKGVRNRDRPYTEFSPRHGERERRSGWGVAPPSRKLWVGNLSSHITENVLSEQFLRFGDIESVAYLPGRSYAYVNFKKEEDAVLALRALHGSNVGGTPLRIEFAKGDEAYVHHKNDRRSVEKGEPPLKRDSRSQNFSPEKSSDKSKGYRSAEPSEVLWIGFPTSLNVDEIILRRAFSPFGEIEKITSFPGRSYAFIRFRSVVAACRAKEALHGKLLNNPRVHICFARNDMPAEHGKGFANSTFSPHLKPNFLSGSSGKALEPLHGDERFESPVRNFHRDSPPFGSSLDRGSRDPHTLDLIRNKSSRYGAEREPVYSGTYETSRLREFDSDRRTAEDFFERHRTCPEDKIPSSHNLTFERPQRVPPFVDSWDLEDRSFPLAKKLKIDLIPDKDLPEYPFSDFEQEKYENLRKPFLDLREHHDYNKKPLDSVPFSLNGARDFSRSLNRHHAEKDDSWGSISRLSTGLGPLSNNSPRLHRSNSESHKPPPLDEIWKWEGTIAKGGTPVCRARCFPVGKVLDFMLPEFLNCTSRTGLDMLAKHYYQAVSSWVVFFVPESDADIGFYGEFMHYLGEKQRAAVAKLGEKITLFLVPPSDFSEQVLKVPGKVSISGVILKFQQNASNFSSLQHPMDLTEPLVPSLGQRSNEGLKIHEGTSFLKPNSPDFRSFSHTQNRTASSSGYLTPAIFPPASKRDDSFPYLIPAHGEKLRDTRMDGVHDQLQLHNPPLTSNWSGSLPVSSSGMGSFITAPNAPLLPFGQSFSKEQFNSRVSQGTDSSGYMPETLASTSVIKFPAQQDIKSQVSSATSISLQPEQLAHLAALLGNQKQSGELPLLKDEREKYSNLSQNPSSQSHTSMLYNNSLLPHAHTSILPGNSSLPSASVEHQIGHGQQMQLQGPQPFDAPPIQNVGQQTNQQEPNSSREDTEADPEKRLQATLQLAAALLQQIQQRAKTVD